MTRGMISCAVRYGEVDWADEHRSRAAVGGPALMGVLDGLFARIGELERCGHDPDGFYFWISVRPEALLCSFCYGAAQVLAEEAACAACGRPAGDPDHDATVVAKVAD